MLTLILDIIAPHHCIKCRRIGHILCKTCQQSIVKTHKNHCLKCGAPIKSVCKSCRLPYQSSWTLGRRESTLESAIELYKFRSARALAPPLAAMLAEITPDFPPETKTIIIPIPTSFHHIRIRGFDHTKLIAKHLAKIKKCPYSVKTLTRASNSVQVGASAKVRKEQAKQAFHCKKNLDPKTHYIILDDVSTTGASLQSAAHLLKQNGAKKISALILASSPDKPPPKLPTKNYPR